jgi:hypothetical protein
MIKLTRDQWSVIELAIESLNPDRLTSWQLDDFASGTNKSEYLDAILFEIDDVKENL